MAPQVYLGLFLTTLATLMYEVLLPRVLSVTMVYHFAFMAVSLAMFGMTVGAIIVHLRPARYTAERVRDDLASNALYHALALVVSFAVYGRIPFLESVDFMAMLTIGITYLVLAVPFVFSGITVALALTRFPGRIASLYAADLAGAAIGCFAVLGALRFTDAPTAVIVVATVAALGAVAFARRGAGASVTRAAVATTALLALATPAHHVLSRAGHPILDLTNRKLHYLPSVYERWNDHSYVEVFQASPGSRLTLGWGMSDRLSESVKVSVQPISIDEKAGTGIVNFDGDTSKVDFLRYDLTNAAHQIRHDGDVCVIGVGGGRDVLSSVYFNQRSVLGIELNSLVLGLLTDVFADFSGHLHRHPKVTLVHDEARSYLSRTDKSFDILQISLIDTFAATTAGAFALAENSLYTVDAWDVFLRRLKPRGVLTVSRYYFHRAPTESYRMLGLGVAALARRGVDDPRSRMVLIRNETSVLAGAAGIGTLLLSPDPFSEDDLAALSRFAKEMNFEIVLSPKTAANPVLETIGNGKDLEAFYDAYPVDITPIDDDRPFFFQMLRLSSVLSPSTWEPGDINWKNAKAVFVLLSLLVVVLLATALCVVVPLWKTREKAPARVAPTLGYFGAIGFGFMFVEMAQMQRLTIFLGHPTYALSVVLFTLLISSGVGSWLVGRLGPRLTPRGETAILVALTLVVLLIGVATPVVTKLAAGASTPGRILVAVALLAVVGFPMGMPFPLGMRQAEARGEDGSLAWLWGINGATSVCSSVLAIIIGLAFGITATFFAGVLSYAGATAVHALLGRTTPPPAAPSPEARAT